MEEAFLSGPKTCSTSAAFAAVGGNHFYSSHTYIHTDGRIHFFARCQPFFPGSFTSLFFVRLGTKVDGPLAFKIFV